MTQFKNLPRFDPSMPYAEQHNGTSEAVMQLQRLVYEQGQKIERLKGESAKAAPAARKTAATSK